MNSKTKFVAQAGLTAALYVVLTQISTMLGLSSGVIQVRFSECLCILPAFMPASIPGLFVGCVISNVLAGGVVWDVVFGSIATLIGAIGTYLLKKNRILCSIPPVLSNAIIVPFILIYAYQVPDAFWFLFLTVGAGEVISVCILGQLLYGQIKRHGSVIGL